VCLMPGWSVLEREQRERMCAMRGRDILECDWIERVCCMPRGDVVAGRGECVFLSCEYIRTTRPKLCRLSRQSELAGAEHLQGGVSL